MGVEQSLDSTIFTRTSPRDYPDFTSAITVGLQHRDALGLSLEKPLSHMQIELPLAPTGLKAEPTPLTFVYDKDTKQYHCDMPIRETMGRVHKVYTDDTSMNGETIMTPHQLAISVDRPFTVW